MHLFRSAIVVISMVLMAPLGSSAIATTKSPLQFSLTGDRTLNLRETGSQMVIETIENALRHGGLALFDEGFQLESSLIYVTEESADGTIKGEIDAAIPFRSGDGHVVFMQPGLVFWAGLEEEERVDGNFGIVYRVNLANKPVGISAIGGASLFYDWDFHRVGHSRLGIGADIQSGVFHGAFNYYHPLSNEKDGQREGFIEKALRGMDLRFALERDVIRAGARLGYWRYDGGAGVADDWKTSVGFDVGIRIVPGVFIEGEWEKHQEDTMLDQRLSLGLAFRFSLPGFRGKSYGDGSMSTNLYKFVEREKRILYEERESGPSVWIVRTDSGDVVEGDIIELEVRLSEALEEDVTINLVGSGSADYGENEDWVLDNGSGNNCDSVTGTGCQVTVTAGQTSVSGAEITINNDGRTNEPPETVVLSVEIASDGGAGLTSGGPLVLTIPADPPLPTVSMSATSTNIAEGGTATLTLTLSEPLGSDATFNLIGSSDDATYGTSASGDWNLSVGGTDCDMASGTSCQVMISADDTTVEAIVEVNTDMSNESSTETFTVSVTVASESTSIVLAGSRSSLNFTISADPPLPTVSLSSDSTTIAEGDTATIILTLSGDIENNATFNLTGSSDDAQYGTSADDDWNLSVDGTDCNMASGMNCQITINAGERSAEVTVETNADSDVEPREEFTVSIAVNSGSRSIVELGSTPSLNFHIPSQFPTVSLNYSGASTVSENSTIRMMIQLSEALTQDVTFNLTLESDDTVILDGASGDFVVQYDNFAGRALQCGNLVENSQTLGIFGNGMLVSLCEPSIRAGSTSIELSVITLADTALHNDTIPENITLSISIPSASANLVELGNPPSQTITIQ